MVRETRNQGRTILIVDDDPDVRALVEVTLVADGHTVHSAKNGHAGLDAAGRVAPDLVITDVMMPELDGWEMVRTLRSRPATALTPVIFLTALSGRRDLLRGFRIGADDYLPKPFEAEELSLRVQRVLRDRLVLSQDAQAIAHSHLEGQLERIGLSPLLVMLDSERKTGTLTLTRDDATCWIRLRDGLVVAAEVEGGPEGGAQDHEAVFVAFEWAGGTFAFREEPVQAHGEGVNTMFLLLEAARRFDEQNCDTQARTS